MRPIPRSGTEFFDSGKFTVVVAVTARDTDAAFYSIDVNFDVLWWGAEEDSRPPRVAKPFLTRQRAIS